MATSDSSSDRSFSSITDVDEVEEMYCEHCDRIQKKYVPAEGFCINCVEYMCDMCLRYHTMYMASHTLQDKKRMPQDFCLEKCDIHTDQLIKFFCDTCQITACSKCKTYDHQDCLSVSHLPAVVAGVENSEELTDLSKSIDDLSMQLEEMVTHINSNLQNIIHQETKALSTISKHEKEAMAVFQRHQQDIIDIFDKKREETIAMLNKEREVLVKQQTEKQKLFEEKFNRSKNDTVKNVQTSIKSDQTKLQSLKDRDLEIKNDLNIISSDLVCHKNLDQRCKIFVTMKKAKNIIKKRILDAKKINANIDTHCQSYIVLPEIKVLDFKSLENADVFFHFREVPSSRRKRNAEFQSKLSNKNITLSCLCLLSDNILLITDFQDCSLLINKNTNVEFNTFNKIEFDRIPRDVTKVEDNKVAVTFPNEGKVKLITFSESMAVINTEVVKVGVDCSGIAYSNNKLIVSYIKPGRVQILDMSGKVLKCFDKDGNGEALFTSPNFLTLSLDNTTIYVSDFLTDTVTSMTLDGEVNAIYRDDQLKKPYQLAVDGEGTVYVCGYYSDNVHQLSSDLKKVKILLDESHGIKYPRCVTYCQSNNRLYLGMRHGIIKVFNISLE